MTDLSTKLPAFASVPDDPGPVAVAGQSILLSTVHKSLEGHTLDLTRQSIFRKFVLGRVFPLFAVVCLLGCQSAQEQASASNATVSAAPKAESTQVATPAIVPTTAAQPAAKPAIVPTTAAEPVAKPAVPAQVVSEGVVAAAKLAFETNKCGTCHFVGVFPVTKPSTAKNDLGSVGITRSSAWISGFLQKKEKLEGKLHMKTFGGTSAELEALSQWLASQKAEPLPASGSN